VRLVVCINSEPFFLLPRRAAAGLAKAKPRRQNVDSSKKDQN